MAIVCKSKLEYVSDPEYYGPNVEVRVSWWFEENGELKSKIFNETYNFNNAADVTTTAVMARIKQAANQVKDLAIASNAIQQYVGQTVTVSLV